MRLRSYTGAAANERPPGLVADLEVSVCPHTSPLIHNLQLTDRAPRLQNGIINQVELQQGLISFLALATMSASSKRSGRIGTTKSKTGCHTCKSVFHRKNSTVLHPSEHAPDNFTTESDEFDVERKSRTA